MYEKLIKALRLCVKYNKATDALMNASQAADAIEELQHSLDIMGDANSKLRDQAPEWIPVTERLPEEDGWYQVYAPGYSGGSSSGLKNIRGNMYSAFKNGKWSIEVGYHKRPGCVKAWMPLPTAPELPKEEANDRT